VDAGNVVPLLRDGLGGGEVTYHSGNYLILLQMDELACFAPGMLALGTEGATPEKAEKYLTLAKEVKH
jgi:hypothetical protein